MMQELLRDIPIQPVTGRTRVVGLFGHPVSHTLSPQMQNRAFAAMKLPYIYVPWHVLPERLGAAVEAVRALNLAGVNITLPHKNAVIQYLDEITPEARLFGAVNTIQVVGERLIGHNPDGPGFLLSLKEQAGFDPAGKRFLLLGAGGSTRPIATQLMLSGAAAVYIANRTYDKAAALCQTLNSVNWTNIFRSLPLDSAAAEFRCALQEVDAVVNTSSAGMYPHHREPSLIPSDLFSPHLLVCDIVYTSRPTALLAAAEQRGCATLAGYHMLVYQGALAIKIWTGLEAPVGLMTATVEQELIRAENEWAKD